MDKKTEGSSLEDHDVSARQVAFEQHGDVELTLVDGLLTACLHGLSKVGSFTLTQDNRVQFAQLLLASRSFNSLRCSWQLLQTGYYTQALTLVRSAMEDDLTALDCEIHQATVEALLDGSGSLGRGNLTYTEMSKRQGDDSHGAWRQVYGSLSEGAAHARKMSVQILVDPDTRELRLGGHYDRDLFIGSCDAFLSALIRILDLVARVLRPDEVPWQRETYPKLKAANEWRDRIKSKVDKGERV